MIELTTERNSFRRTRQIPTTKAALYVAKSELPSAAIGMTFTLRDTDGTVVYQARRTRGGWTERRF